jgi:hypothetical protein
MDDTCCHDFFTRPIGPRQRRYEALRAVFVEQRPQKQVADQFGYTYGSLRQLIHQFRTQCQRAGPPPFFSPSPAADPTARTPSRLPPAP